MIRSQTHCVEDRPSPSYAGISSAAFRSPQERASPAPPLSLLQWSGPTGSPLHGRDFHRRVLPTLASYGRPAVHRVPTQLFLELLVFYSSSVSRPFTTRTKPLGIALSEGQCGCAPGTCAKSFASNICTI